MRNEAQQPACLHRDAHVAYAALPLLGLFERIVHQDDKSALNEFHANRTPFRHNGGPPLRFIEYIDARRKQILCRKNVPARYDEAVDRACDLTLDKFYNLPLKSGKNVKQNGVDCRLYFEPILYIMKENSARNGKMSQIEEEIVAARLLQSLVKKHFDLSLMEALRHLDPLRTRYSWKVNGGALSVWMPTRMAGAKKRRWLEKNIDRPDPRRPGERDRVQDIINKRLRFGEIIPLEYCAQSAAEPEPRKAAQTIPAEGLAKAVAEEKANNLGRQRPTIRNLGKRPLKRMILQIIEELSTGQYRDSTVASAFGLKKATFSRFAGSRWRRRKNGALTVPDLWRNTAQVLAHYPPFTEALLTTGIWKRLDQVLNASSSRSTRRK